MEDLIARGFLLFSGIPLIAGLVIIGLIWIDRKIFYHAVCLVFLSILLNVALKATFQIPLSPSLHKIGYAFPSGHTQLVTVFYGWLALKAKHKGFSFLISFLILGIALSLIHFGYHNIKDVMGGFICGILLILGYNIVSFKPKLPLIILGLGSLLFLYNAVFSPISIRPHTWMGFYGLWGFIMSESLISKGMIAPLKLPKTVATLFCILAFLISNFCFSYVPLYLTAVNQLQWFIIGVLINYFSYNSSNHSLISQGHRALY